MVLSIATICICTARRLSNNFPTFGMAFSVPSRRRVRNSLMQIEPLKTSGPEPGATVILNLLNKLADPRNIPGGLPAGAFIRVRKSFVNCFPISYRAATKTVPLIPMPPRRRREGLTPQGQCGVKSLTRAADSPVPEPTLRHRCKLPSRGTTQQKSPHHQARDTLQGDEGA